MNYVRHKEDLFIIWDIKQQIEILKYTSLAGYDEYRIVNSKIQYLEMLIDGLIKIEHDRFK